MVVDYAVTQMGLFDYDSDVAPRAKTMRVNGITTFLLHIYQCITLHLKNIVSATLIAEAALKPFQPRIGFKNIKKIATSPNFEEACKQFSYESGKYKALQKKTLTYNVIKPPHDVLQFFMTIELTLMKI